MPEKILIIRETDEFSRILVANGFEIINLPLIETRPLKDLSNFKNKLAQIDNYDGVFLTSRNAARILANELRENEIHFNGKVYVLGRKSFEILKNENLKLVFVDRANTARELLEEIPIEDLRGKSLLFVRGTQSLRVVPDFLETIATVDEAIVYDIVEREIEIDKIKLLREKLETGEIAAACFFSPSGAKSFIKQFGEKILHHIVIATIGKTTAEFFKQQNLAVDFISSKANAEDFALELIKYLENGSIADLHRKI